jgi:hypothetical protein
MGIRTPLLHRRTAHAPTASTPRIPTGFTATLLLWAELITLLRFPRYRPRPAPGPGATP